MPERVAMRNASSRIPRCAAGEQGTGKMVKHPGTAQKLHGFVEVVNGFEPEFG